MPLLTNEYLNDSPKVPKNLYYYCSTHTFFKYNKHILQYHFHLSLLS